MVRDRRDAAVYVAVARVSYQCRSLIATYAQYCDAVAELSDDVETTGYDSSAQRAFSNPWYGWLGRGRRHRFRVDKERYSLG